MKRITGIGAAALAALLGGSVAVSVVSSQEATERAAVAPSTAPSTQPTTRPVKAKALSENVNRGLNWLAEQQLASGGWGAGEESQQMRSSGQQIERSANVADTSVACLALLRSGSTPSDGPYATHIRRGVEFVCAHVEKADADSLFVTDIRNTRLQSKLGAYVDTFAAAVLLAEVKDRMGDEAWNRRVLAALDKVMDKIEKNQQADGTFAGNGGWAPVLSLSLCSKFLNRAAQQNVANGRKPMPTPYETDVYLWAQEQATLLEARQWDALDPTSAAGAGRCPWSSTATGYPAAWRMPRLWRANSLPWSRANTRAPAAKLWRRRAWTAPSSPPSARGRWSSSWTTIFTRNPMHERCETG